MAKQPKPACPACGSNKQVTLNGTAGETAHCGRCGGTFDTLDVLEGGDFDDRRVDARLIREEEARQRKLDRLGRRK